MAHIIGTPNDDILNGTVEDDLIEGLDGNDNLTGGGGNDALDGGTGADSMAGGPGDDVYYVDAVAGCWRYGCWPGDNVVENASEGIDEVRMMAPYSIFGGSYTLLANVENLTLLGNTGSGTGNGLPNVLTGNDGDNWLTGGGGADMLVGGCGIDTAWYNGSPTGVTVSLLTNTGSGGDAEGDSLSGIENLTGSAFADTLIGDSGANRLDGEDGDDTLVGGAGSDQFDIWSGSDLVDAGAGDDLIWTSGGGWGTVQTITGGPGRDTLRFGETLEGEVKFTDFTAGAGGDILDVDALIGQSAFWGGYVGGNPFDASVGVLRLVRQGADTLLQWDPDGASGAGSWLTQAVLQNETATSLTAENIKGGIPPRGGPVPGEVIVGSEGDEYLAGGIGPDHISGLGGNDQIWGWFGDDKIDGGPGNDEIQGAEGNDTLLGDEGIDRLMGQQGNDILLGMGGNDQLDGGDGADTASYAGSRSQYGVLKSYGSEVVVGSVSEGLDSLEAIETLSFADESLPTTRANTPLEYIASYPDLIDTFGADADAGLSHFGMHGYAEGRTVSFDGLDYIASYADLINAFRDEIAGNPDPDEGSNHYIAAGHSEGRQVAFDGLAYIATYGDLINALGADPDAGAIHYIVSGHSEGRITDFDGIQYIASYGDLIEAFHTQVAVSGSPEDIGATHYIASGYNAYRSADSFDAAQYLSNYTDLQAAFGTDTEAATIHYITYGYFEHRTDDPLI